VNADNIVRQVTGGGQDLEIVCREPGRSGSVCQAARSAFRIFSDVVNSSTQMQNLTTFTQFSVGPGEHALPNFSFIVPNLMDDAHDGPLSAADAWLQTNIAPLISSAAFQKARVADHRL